MIPQTKLYLGNLAAGLEFQSEMHSLDAEQIIAFAKQFDPQPFHMDAEAAKETFFKALVASGWHTMAITMKLLTQSVPFAHGLIGAGAQIEWPTATRPTDILHVRSKIMDIRTSQSKPDRAFVSLQSHTLNQNGDVRQVLNANLLAFNRD